MSEIFRSRIAVLAIALFSSLMLPTESHGGTLTATLEACAIKLGFKMNDAKIDVEENPSITSDGPRMILDFNEPDATNKVWISQTSQIFETQLRLNSSLEYVPHSLYAEVHDFIDKTIASKEQDFYKAVVKKMVSSRSEKKIQELLTYLKQTSQELKTPIVHQVDFIYFAQNATRFFSLFEKDGISRASFARHESLFSGGLIIKHHMDYEVLRRLSFESLIIPTNKDLTIADFNLADIYPIYFLAVSKDGAVADGRPRDAEGLLDHDIIHTHLTSRFFEIMKNLNGWLPRFVLSHQETTLLKEKIEKNLRFVNTIYKLIPQSMPLRERRLVTTALFYAVREDPVLNTFGSRGDTLYIILKKWSDIFTSNFAEKFARRVNDQQDLGFYFGRGVTTPVDVYEAFETLKIALKLILEKQPQTATK